MVKKYPNWWETDHLFTSVAEEFNSAGLPKTTPAVNRAGLKLMCLAVQLQQCLYTSVPRALLTQSTVEMKALNYYEIPYKTTWAQ